LIISGKNLDSLPSLAVIIAVACISWTLDAIAFDENPAKMTE
jgi:hypothetical protein